MIRLIVVAALLAISGPVSAQQAAIPDNKLKEMVDECQQNRATTIVPGKTIVRGYASGYEDCAKIDVEWGKRAVSIIEADKVAKKEAKR